MLYAFGAGEGTISISGNPARPEKLSTGQHNRVSTSRVVIPAVFWPESTKKLDAGLKIAGMTSGEMDIFFCGGVLRHILRARGAVTKALCSLRHGDVIGVRGPFGAQWPLGKAEGKDVLLIAGGLGFAPLRPLPVRPFFLYAETGRSFSCERVGDWCDKLEA